MNYITNTTNRNDPEFKSAEDEAHFYRVKFPNDYQKGSLEVTKFEKNLDRTISYQFINTFPKSITPIPVTYGNADILKVSVSFNYDRYVVNRKSRKPSLLSAAFNLFNLFR